MRKVIVREIPGVGWDIVQREEGKAFPVRRIQSAAEALRTIQQEAKDIADVEGKDVVTVEWYPVTSLGKMVVKAIT